MGLDPKFVLDITAFTKATKAVKGVGVSISTLAQQAGQFNAALDQMKLPPLEPHWWEITKDHTFGGHGSTSPADQHGLGQILSLLREAWADRFWIYAPAVPQKQDALLDLASRMWMIDSVEGIWLLTPLEVEYAHMTQYLKVSCRLLLVFGDLATTLPGKPGYAVLPQERHVVALGALNQLKEKHVLFAAHHEVQDYPFGLEFTGVLCIPGEIIFKLKK